MSEHTKAVTDASFPAEVLEAKGAVLVDFWAEWCGPCKAIAPAVDEIARDFAERLTVAKVNIDENPATPGQFAVRGIPTLILFKDGKPVAQKVGAAPRSALRQWVEDALA
jgi:thioredoxin 1